MTESNFLGLAFVWALHIKPLTLTCDLSIKLIPRRHLDERAKNKHKLLWQKISLSFSWNNLPNAFFQISDHKNKILEENWYDGTLSSLIAS